MYLSVTTILGSMRKPMYLSVTTMIGSVSKLMYLSVTTIIGSVRKLVHCNILFYGEANTLVSYCDTWFRIQNSKNVV